MSANTSFDSSARRGLSAAMFTAGRKQFYSMKLNAKNEGKTMSRKEPPQVLNFDNVQTKRRLMEKINKLRGLHEVSIKPRKLTRSLNANAYYWCAFVQPWTEWLRDEWGDPTITTEQAHAVLKLKVLGPKEKVIESTGEVIELIPTTHDMNKDDFGIYLDKAKEWLAEFAGIVVLDSDLFWESKEKRSA